MENHQITLLLNKWEEVQKKITGLKDNSVQPDFYENVEQDLVSFLREFYRLKESENNKKSANKQHLKYDDSKSNDIHNAQIIKEIAAAPAESENNNSYPKIQFYFSLNDKFYFLRELFDGNSTDMNQIISILNTKTSLNDSLAYMKDELSWDMEAPTVARLIEIIEKRFDNRKIWESYS